MKTSHSTTTFPANTFAESHPGTRYILQTIQVVYRNKNYTCNMLFDLVCFLTLLFYTLTVSQPLFYWIALTATSRKLSAPAYIEMRNHIDNQMQKRGPAMYYGTLSACVVLVVLALMQAGALPRITSFIALLALITDITLMMKGNVPINAVIQKWTPDSYPADWQEYRDRWLNIFGYRQVALFIGFTSLLAGVVFG